MSRILVTVGTTPFPRLIAFFDAAGLEHEVVLQTAVPYESRLATKAFAFTDRIVDWYGWADLIVTHAGAGSVFQMLEAGLRISVIPNVDRSDAHQRELAAYVRDHALAHVVEDLGAYASAERLIDEALAFESRPYLKTPFTAAGALLQLLGSPQEGLRLPRD